MMGTQKNSFTIDGVTYLTVSGIRDAYADAGYKDINLNSLYQRISRIGPETAINRWGVTYLKDPRDKKHKYAITTDTFKTIWLNRIPKRMLGRRAKRLVKALKKIAQK